MDHDFLTLIYRRAPICTIQRLKLKFDKLLSNLGFKFNLRCYNKEEAIEQATAQLQGQRQVGQCRLTLSNPP